MFSGERLEEIRKDKGYTQKQLGTMVGVSANMISVYERGLKKPSIEKLISICEALDISMDYLCELTDIELSASKTYYLPLSRDYPPQFKEDLLEHMELLKIKYKLNK